MKIIRSRDNQIYKLCSRLAVRKYRDAYGLYLAEGEKVVCDARAAGKKLRQLIAAEGCALPDGFSCPAAYMEKKLFEKLAQTETSQGLLAVIEKDPMDEALFLQRIAEKAGNVAVLDRLQDPGNIGTIIRTADAAGYSGVMTVRGTADLYSPKIVRAAAGSLFRMPVFSAESPEQAAALLEAAGKRILAAGFDTELYYYDVDMKENVGLIIGNEGSGVSPKLRKLAHRIIKIPMEGSIDSLNASVAAGILMYESLRK